jgi:ubiquinone/menaquinone biosynthesis C-methylase UbiE
MAAVIDRKVKPYKGVNMEGPLADWYAKNTAGQLAEFQRLAAEIAADLEPGAQVLEVAPGPGFLAIELARAGLAVTGLDISRSFVRIATAGAARAGVAARFEQGDAANMPFEAQRFDFIACRAAFKNFADPVGALREMRRVLKPGGRARLMDMRRDASDDSIASEVARMELNRLDAFVTRGVLRSLRRRAYSEAEFERMIDAAGFSAEVQAGAIGFDIILRR